MKNIMVTALLFAAVILSISGCKKNPVVPSSAVPAALSVPSYPLTILVDDCEDNDNVDALGGYWFTFDDTKASTFGKSSVIPRNGAQYTMSFVGPDWETVKNGPNAYCARMQGTVMKWNSTYTAFIGEGIQMGPVENPRDLSNFTGIRFWAKAGATDTVGKYRLSFKSHASINPDPASFDYFGVTFTPGTKWQLYDYKLSDFALTPGFSNIPGSFTYDTYKLASMGNVTDIQIQTKNDVSSAAKGYTWNVDFWIDNILLYRD
jgi:hypothetical protein